MSEPLGNIYYEVEADTSKLLNSEKAVTGAVDKMTGALDKNDKAVDKNKKGLDKLDGSTRKTTGTTKKFGETLSVTGSGIKKTANEAAAGAPKLNALAAGVKKANAEAQGATGSFGGLNRILAGVATVAGVSRIVSLADAWTDLQNRLRLVTSTQEELAKASDDVYQIAMGTSQELGSVATVYQRFAENADRLGISLDDVAGLTDTVSKAVAISGASAASAQAALTQFGQALGSGTLRGEELNSVLEQTPALAQAIADGLGVAKSELRTLAADGKITSNELVQALKKAADGVEQQFATRIKTVSQAWEEFNTALTRFVGEASNATGASQAIAAAISGMAQSLDTMVNILLTAGAGALAAYILKMGALIIEKAKATKATSGLVIAEIQLARQQRATALAAVAEAKAMESSAKQRALLAARTKALEIASSRLKAALLSVTGILGGPVGIIALAASAATGITLFGNSAEEAEGKTEGLQEKIDKLAGSYERLTVAQAQVQLDEIRSEFVKTSEQATRLYNDIQSYQRAIDANPDGENVEKYRKRLTQLRAEFDSLQQSAEEFRKAESRLLGIINGDGESGGKPSSPSSSDSSVSNAQKRLQALRQEVDLLGKVGIEREKLRAIQSLGDSATAPQKQEAAALAETIHNLKEAEKAEEERRKGVEAGAEAVAKLERQLKAASMSGEDLAVSKAKASLSDWADPADVARVEQLTRALYELQEREANANLLGSVDPFVGEQQQFQERLQSLQKLKEAELLEEERYNVLKEQAERDHQQNMVALQEEAYRKQSASHEMLMATLDNLESAGTNAITGLLTGTANATDAMQMLGTAILNEAVGALVQMGIQIVKNRILETAAAASSAATAATTGASITAAYAPAAAAASIATSGGAAAYGLTAMTSTIPAMVGLFAGGRQYGGPVAANKLYRINENGKPEVFTASNGQQYMLPNARGEVVSNGDATAGSGSVMLKAQAPARVTIINQFNGDGSVETKAPAGMESMGREIQEVVDRHINQKLRSEMRPGGLLYKRGGNG